MPSKMESISIVICGFHALSEDVVNNPQAIKTFHFYVYVSSLVA